MPQRITRLDEEVHELRRSIRGLRGDVDRSITDQVRFTTWMVSCMTQLMDASGRTYQAFDSTLVGSSQFPNQRSTRRRTDNASTSAPQIKPGNFVMSDSKDSMVTYTSISSDDGSLEYPPSQDFVPKHVYLEFMPLKDDVLPAEEQPLPAVVSPTADLPCYITESNPEEDLEENEEDHEEDPTDYPTNRDEDDDEEEEFSRDDDDDEEEHEDEDGKEE
ncbi:hypothetical protein Tco_1002041 [Tanacetum coccineum]|uniref:Uncharacterized protein n=1 Tax=Tanacetum coccineum TaxID=301880 RepID=A0ABQ5F5U2_9ASTR